MYGYQILKPKFVPKEKHAYSELGWCLKCGINRNRTGDRCQGTREVDEEEIVYVKI